MAKLASHPVMGQLTGTIGNLTFVKHTAGEVIVRKRRVRNSNPTTAETARQQAFANAVAFAKDVWATQPNLRSRYNALARAKGRQGFHLAKADFLLPPKVHEIDASAYTGNPGQTIRIRAEDDFEVKSVVVSIRDLSGGMLETGAALWEGETWKYSAQTQVSAGQTVIIQATATDHPGHIGTRQVDHACGPRGA